MIAVIKTGGKQYSVKTGQILKVEKLVGKKGESIVLNNVLALNDSSSNIFGNPIINNVSVKAKIIDQIRDKKIIVFKKRRRQNYRSTKGHRQYLTVLKIESINQGDKKSPVKNETKTIEKKETKKTISKKRVTKKTTIKKTTTKKTVSKKK